ncbi:MAG: HAD family hydrolase [Pelagimonas sp.]|jgi:phosphoglycolate phosphatase|nr:HAD family hydrolase [Pelagimonas sp.]
MDLSTIKAILFDKDGTLLKYEETWGPVNRKAALAAAGQDQDLANRLLAATGYDLETGTVQVGSTLGAGNSQEIARAWAQLGAVLSEQELVDMLDRYFSDAMQDAVPVQNIGGVTQAFHAQGYTLGVASSDSENAIHVFLASQGLSSFYDFVVGYNSGYGHKPDPGMLNAFCDQHSLDPAQVAMVGDNPQDMEMACRAKAGLRIAVLSGNGTAKDLEPLADFTLNDISELPVLFGLGAGGADRR